MNKLSTRRMSVKRILGSKAIDNENMSGADKVFGAGRLEEKEWDGDVYGMELGGLYLQLNRYLL